MKFTLAFLLICIVFNTISIADPMPKKTITHENSNCIVYSSGGEYPLYSAKIKGIVVYQPESDGISQAVFSPNGSLVAFVGSEIGGVDIKSSNKVFSVVILDCNSAKLTGYLNGFPNSDFKWLNENTFQYTDSANGKTIKFKH